MDKRPNFTEYELKIYEFWEKLGYFTPKIPTKERARTSKKKPFTILLPPPNANDPLHVGHAVYVVEDVLCRWHRMMGELTLFLPGTDHAGIETQYVFEQQLAQKGESRFDFDRETLYQMTNDFVEKNRGIAKTQLKRLGFSLDWTREKYTLDSNILETVLETFRKLHRDGLVYRGERIVNYCTQCGTAFSDLEVVYQEKKDPLYFIKYGPFVLATVRPETKFGDTAVAVNPKDKRYQNWIGKEFIYQSLIGPRKMKVVADELVDPEFGTGVVKVTPAHDPNDFEIAQRHNLPILKVINPDGKLNQNAGRFAGLSISEAREKVVEELQKRGDLEKVDHNYVHRIGICYRCKHTIEPMLIPQWFVKTNSKLKIKNAKLRKLLGVAEASLGEMGAFVVKHGDLEIIPQRFKKLYLRWMENIKDWNISRQIVWGPRIPVWYCLDCNPEITIDFIDQKGQQVSGTFAELEEKCDFLEIKRGLQHLSVPKDAVYALDNKPCQKCSGQKVLQETDTFDTWFSSGQWPLTTLGYPYSEDFKYFYPTSVLDTMWDILFFWVARMVMFGLYLAGEIPFEIAHMHCRVVDEKGQKMSKSRGNVIDPMKMVEEYGADALRISLIFGAAPGSDIHLGDDKIRSMRNFITKIWNASRFVLSHSAKLKTQNPASPASLAESRRAGGSKLKTISQISKLKNLNEADREILIKMNQAIKSVTQHLQNFRFDLAIDTLYHFFWHTFCDQYIEQVKPRLKEQNETAAQVLLYVLINSLKLLHPFIPFVTEEIYQKIREDLELKKMPESIMIASWPKPNFY